MKIVKFIKKRYKRIIISVVSLISAFIMLTVPVFASTHPLVPYEAILTNVSTDNNTTSTSSFPQVNGNMYHPSFSGASNFFEDVTCLFAIRYRPDSIRGSYYHISAEFILFYADLHDKDYFANSKVTVEFCADKSFGSTTYKYTEVISPTITNPSGNDTRYSFSIDYDFQYLTNNLNLFNHCRISIEPGNPDNFEGEPGTPSDFYWIGFQRFSISEPYTPNQDIIDNQNQNADKILNGWEEKPQPNTDSIGSLNDVENGINQSTAQGRDNVTNTFSNFGLSSNSSVGRGMLAFTNIAKEFLGLTGFSDIINFGLVLGLVAFLLGIAATWSGVSRAGRQQGYKDGYSNAKQRYQNKGGG